MKRIKPVDILMFAGLALITLVVCMCSPLNPLSGKAPGGDSCTFMTIAQGLLHGKLPYVDYFDNKGPLLFLIDGLGLLSGGFTGVWFVEFVMMFVSVLFAWKTARVFAGMLPSLLSTGFAFLILTRFFEGGNLTEEYALPFMFIALYLFTGFYFKEQDGNGENCCRFVVIGACMGATLMLRPNMFSLWGGFLSALFVVEALQKQIRLFWKQLLYFTAGIATALVPVVVFLLITSSLDDCVEQYILYNFVYIEAGESVPGLSVASLALSVIHAVNNAIFPLIVAVIWLLRNDNKRREYGYFAGYMLSLLVSFLLLSMSRRGFAHYNIVLVPFYVPAFAYSSDKFFGLFASLKGRVVRLLVPTFLVFLFFNSRITETIRGIYALTKSETKKECAEFGREINKHTGENSTISVLGYNCWVYLYTQCRPVSKYISSPSEISKTIQNEFLADIFKGQPDIIVVPLTDSVCDEKFRHEPYSQVFSLIEESYEELFKANGCVVFKHR
jgi:hypothetical protein